jgi:hypothetical protein
VQGIKSVIVNEGCDFDFDCDFDFWLNFKFRFIKEQKS